MQITRAGVLVSNTSFSGNYASIAGGAVDLELTAASISAGDTKTSSMISRPLRIIQPGAWTNQVIKELLAALYLTGPPYASLDLHIVNL